MRVLYVALAVLGGCGTTWAQSLTQRGDSALSAYQWSESGTPVISADERLPTTAPVQGSAGIYEFKEKSVARAFAYSLILPGAGQLYTGSKLKAFIFLGIEAAGWVAYAHYRSAGADQTSEFEAFADTHWHEPPYWDSLKVYRDVDKWQDDAEFAHHLPYTINENGDTVANKNHEYYENIGKYDQFVWGWDDLQQIQSPVNSTSPELSFHSALRMDYEDMRQSANAQYDHARAAGIVLIANHVISALEAGFSAKRANNRAEHASALDVKVNLVNLEDTPTPWVRVAYRF